MAVTITSSLRVALVSGTNVTFSAPVVPEVTTDDIFNPNNPTQTLTDMLLGISSAKLLSTTTVDATVVGNHTLYTVPAGNIMIPRAGSAHPPARC